MRKVLILLLTALFVLSATGFDKVKQELYDELRLIMTKQEEKEFKSIKDENGLQQFVEKFWEKRNPDPSTPQNEAREVYYKRLKAAEKYFREPGKKGWLTDRGRIFVLLGPPSKRDQRMMSYEDAANIAASRWSAQARFSLGSTGNLNGEIWYYDDLKLVLVFLDEGGTGQYRLINPPPVLLDYLDKSKKDFGIKSNQEGPLPISADVDLKGKKLYVHIPLSALSFKKKDGKFYADIKLEFYYTNAKTGVQKSFAQEMKFEVKEKDIKDPEKRVTIPLNIAPLKGVYILDIVVQDVIGQNEGKKRYKLKI